MAGPSISALASLLVAATSNGDGGDAATSGHEQRQQPHNYDQTHASLSEAARRGAQRKAGVLSKYRRVIVRWTGASGTLQRRQDFKSAGGTGCTTAVVDRREEVRLQSDRVSPLLSLVSTERLGRHIVAAGPLPGGTLLLKETPFAWSLHPEFSGEFCAHCLHKVNSTTILCPKCELVAYCSQACATAALRGWHGGECLASSGAPLETDMSGLSPACRVALRSLRRVRQEEKPPNTCETKDGELRSGPPACATANGVRIVVCPDGPSSAVSSLGCGDGGDVAWPTVCLRHLQEHYTARSTRERELLETEAAIAAVLASGGGRGAGPRSESNGEASQPADLLAAELVTILVKVSTNAFTVSSLRCSDASGEGRVRQMTHAKVAVGVYLTAAMLNHSCTPNAVATFNGREMRVVATRAIDEGEPVTISYGPLSSKISSTRERQAFLRQAYCFQCECEACRRPAARTTIASASRPGTSEAGNEQHPSLGRDRGGAAAEASWKRTEFACCRAAGRGCCPGTLLLGVPRAPPPLSSLARRGEGCDGDDCSARRDLPVAEASVAPSSSPGGGTKLELWCDRCGGCLQPDVVDALLAEDGEDHRLWDEAMAAVSHAGLGDEGDGQGGGLTSSGLPLQPGHDVPSSATSLALGLVVERIEWREARLCPLSMRRAIAHDVHARILATRGDFAGAADACARAVHVLVKRFAPEDQELGVEFLKLAELCFNAGWIDKCNAACRKARLSLEVCLQPGDEQLVALDTLQGFCAERTAEELARLEELLGSLAADSSTPAPERLVTFSTAKVRLEDGLSKKVAKFEKRLSETDPVSGAPRYGESMTAKVVALGARHQTLLQRLGQLEADITAAVSLHESREAISAEEAQKREAERQQEEEARGRIRQAEAEEERRRAVAAQSILERERERQAAEANRSREERQRAAEREAARQAEDKRRRELEAQELTRSVAVGAAGVEDGLRRIDDACGGNRTEKKAAVQALQQILRNVASNPEDPRFRRIKRDNENFQRALGRFEGGIQILLSSGFRMQVEEGQTVLVMNEPDLSEDMDGWSEWYKNITEAVARLKVELDERF
eukprot:g9813.t1